MKDGKILVTVASQTFLILGKHFKCSTNAYLMHLEELDLTSNTKVSVLNFKYEKRKRYFNLMAIELNRDHRIIE